MRKKMFWKKFLSLGLIVLIILPAVSFAKGAPASAVSSKPASNTVPVLNNYSKLAAKYLVDCDEVHNQLRPSGERLKYCLTIAKELRDKFNEFYKTLDTLVKNVKNAGKWTREIDSEFDKGISRSGLDTETVAMIRASGGFRAFYEKSLSDLRGSRSELDREIKLLEEKIKKSASAENPHFQPVSSEPAAESLQGGRSRVKLLLKIAKAIADAATYFCTFTSYCQ